MSEANSMKCIVKTGTDNKPCGKQTEYLSAGQKGSTYSGYAHTDGTKQHNAVPAKHV